MERFFVIIEFFTASLGFKMSYCPPASKDDIERAEQRFLRFFVFFALITFAMACSFWTHFLNQFWQGNRLWSLGSMLVFVSVLHSRYFDIKKTASPDNRLVHAHDQHKWGKSAECFVNHSWVVGFMLIALSRWVAY